MSGCGCQRNVSWAAASLCLGLLLLAGCASTPPNMAPGPPPPDAVPLRADLRDFILGPGDEIEVSVWRQPDLTKVLRVSNGGVIQMPLVGDMRVAGLSAFQVRDGIRAELGEFFVEPQVTVAIRALRSQKVFVTGEVRRPGVFPLEPDLTVLDAVARAGDFNVDAKRSEVLLVRKGEGNRTIIYPLDLERTLTAGDLTQNPRVQAEDIIFVPPLLLTDLARNAVRITAILSPLLALESAFSIFQDIVIKWPATQRVFEGKSVISEGGSQNIIIVSPPLTQ